MLPTASCSRNFRGYYLYMILPNESSINIDTKILCIHNSVKLHAFNFYTKIMALALHGLVLLLGKKRRREMGAGKRALLGRREYGAKAGEM